MWGFFFNDNKKQDIINNIEAKNFNEHHEDYTVCDEICNLEISSGIDNAAPIIKDELESALSESIHREILGALIADLRNQDLSKINTEKDLVHFLIDFGQAHGREIDQNRVKHYLHTADIDLNQRHSNTSKTEIAMRVGLTIAGIVAVHWLSGPIAASAARVIYEQAYGTLWGIPSQWNPMYWISYFPGREHVGNLAYQWAPWTVNIIGGSLYHKAVDVVKCIGIKTHSIYKEAKKASRRKINSHHSVKKTERPGIQLCDDQVEIELIEITQRLKDLDFSDSCSIEDPQSMRLSQRLNGFLQSYPLGEDKVEHVSDGNQKAMLLVQPAAIIALNEIKMEKPMVVFKRHNRSKSVDSFFENRRSTQNYITQNRLN